MRRSKTYIPTLKEIPSDAIATSHKLMLRAGMIRMVSAGVYAFLPVGWKAALNVMEILRNSMDMIGAQEFHLPTLTPIELWDETGRSSDFGEEMFRLKDRKGSSFSLAPTHEEIICSIARGTIRSWRDLPQIWYQIQTKFRDEPRPRGGMLRMRQFLMKDSYSLDRNEEGLDQSYQLHREAYQNIFEVCGLDYFIVGASSGLMGGGQSEEFMVASDAGEDFVARCSECNYSANIEVASSIAPPLPEGEKSTMKEVSTPNLKTVDEVSKYLNVPKGRMVKTLIYVTASGPVMVLVSGEDELSEAKLVSIVGGMIRPAHHDEIKQWMHAEAGFLGPHGEHQTMPIYADIRLQDCGGMITGANRNDYHVTGLQFGRDVHPDDYVDLRVAKEGERCPACSAKLNLVKAIELGHIFKLGTKYSKAMGATFLDENGSEQPIIMGSYGIGVERIISAVVEANCDKDGIRWSAELSPMDINVISLGAEDEVKNTAETIYEQLRDEGYEVLWDDRDARPGVKMKDADLIGIPIQLIVSARNLAEGNVEIKDRFSDERSFVSKENVITAVDNLWSKLLNVE